SASASAAVLAVVARSALRRTSAETTSTAFVTRGPHDGKRGSELSMQTSTSNVHWPRSRSTSQVGLPSLQRITDAGKPRLVGGVAGLAAGAARPVDGVAAGRVRAAVDHIHQTVAVAVVDGVADPVVVAIGGRAMRAPRRRVAPVDGTWVAVGAGERGVDAARG